MYLRILAYNVKFLHPLRAIPDHQSEHPTLVRFSSSPRLLTHIPQMSWKPKKINLPKRQTRSLSPQKPAHLQPLHTSHEVRSAYLRGHDTVSTPTGVFAFQRGRATPDHLQPTPPTAASDSAGRPFQPEARSSPPPGFLTSEPGWSSTFSDPIGAPNSNTTIKASKAQKQWTKWTTTIIPSLLQPYLRLLRTTQSLRHLSHDTEVQCTCGRLNLRMMTVTCLSFDGTVSLLDCYTTFPC